VGRRGPPPLPSAEKKRRGTYRADRARREPKPRLIAPPCPSWLDPTAQTEWRRVAPELERLELLTELDATALAAYCDSYATWRKAMKVLREKGLTFTAKKSGYVGQRPEVSIGERAILRMRTFCIEFGMTPSARGRMRLPDETPKEDEFEDFLGEPKGARVVPFPNRGRKTKRQA